MAWNPFRRKGSGAGSAHDTGPVTTFAAPVAPRSQNDAREPNDPRVGQWAELAALLSPDSGLVEVVLLAHRSPAEYLRLHGADAENRGIEGDDDAVDPWFALVDWLIENDLGHELDWKENAAELAWGLSRMTEVLSRGVDLQSVDDANAHLTFGMLRANALLAPVGLELLVFDIDSDSYPVVLVETAKRDRIVALAAELGHRADVMTLERARREGGRDYADEIEL